MSLSWFTSSKNNFRSMSTTYFLPCLINSCAVRTAQCAIPSVRLRDRHPRTGPSLYSPLQTFFRAEFLAEPALAFATVAVTASGHFRFYFISDLFMPMLGRRGQASRLTQHTSTQPTPRRRDASATYAYACLGNRDARATYYPPEFRGFSFRDSRRRSRWRRSASQRVLKAFQPMRSGLFRRWLRAGCPAMRQWTPKDLRAR